MKRLCIALLALALVLCAAAAAEETGALDFRALKPGDLVYIRHDATGAYVSSAQSGAGLAPVKDAAGAQAFTVEFGADGYVYFGSDAGYLTSGATGNSLTLAPGRSHLALWAFEEANSRGGFYLRNMAAMYGASAQYLEVYSGRVTTYGLRSGGGAYVFSLVSERPDGGAGERADDERALNEPPFSLTVMLTGDVHGALYHSYYPSGASGTGNRGMTRLSTLIKRVRAENANTLLIDTGDLVQGTPLTYYYCFLRPDAPDPAVLTLRALGYDAWVPGNHEFNYGLDILNRQIEYAQSAPRAGEARVPVLAANYVSAGERWTPWAGAYIVRDFETEDGRGVRVGIIGLGTPNIPNWETPANYEGIEFKSFLAAWNHYEAALNEREGCDIVIVACHSGVEDARGALIDGEYYDWSDQVTALVTHTAGIDIVLGGHSHFSGVETLYNADGEAVPVLFAGYGASELGVATIEYDPLSGEMSVECGLMPVNESVAPDAELTALIKPYEDECVEMYMNEVIGVAEGDFVSPGDMLAPCAFLDLMNEAQLDSCYDKLGYTPTLADDTRPDMSFAAPLNSGYGTLINAGDIRYGQLFTLYRFENWLMSVRMSAPEIRAWLEAAANQYGKDASGALYGGGSYCDCLYGEGVDYVIDMSRERGDRVTGLRWAGGALDISDTRAIYTVVINNYRYTNGGSYVKYVRDWLDERGIESDFALASADGKGWQINDSRLVFSTQYGMPFGDDAGQVRSLIAEYIRARGSISDQVRSTWRVTANR